LSRLVQQDTQPDQKEAPDAVPTTRMLNWARNSAAYRLSKAMMSEKQLRDAIRRKAVQKFEDITASQVAALVEAAVRFGYEQKALDDRTFAEVSTRSGTRSGKSRRAIAQKLSLKGISSDIADQVMMNADDLYSAAVHARKRGLGPFRRRDAEDDRFGKEMASLARAGFSYDIGRRVLSMTWQQADDLILGGPATIENRND
jgi:regulatory protein